MNKPWTESRGSIIATELDVRKAEAINGHLVRSINLLPTKAGDPILPVAIGIWADVRALMKPEGSATALRRALGAYLHSKGYYFASAQPDAMRHDIDGRPVEEVSAEDRLTAQRSFMEMKRKDTVKDEPLAAPPPPVVQLTKAEMIRASLLKRK